MTFLIIMSAMSDERLNMRPRKKLNYSTPKNEFFKRIANFALAS